MRGLLSDFLSPKIVFFRGIIRRFFFSKNRCVFAAFSLICFLQKIVVFRGIFPHNSSPSTASFFVVFFPKRRSRRLRLLFKRKNLHMSTFWERLESWQFSTFRKNMHTDLFFFWGGGGENENQNRPLWRNFTSKKIDILEKKSTFSRHFYRN